MSVTSSGEEIKSWREDSRCVTNDASCPACVLTCYTMCVCVCVFVFESVCLCKCVCVSFLFVSVCLHVYFYRYLCVYKGMCLKPSLFPHLSLSLSLTTVSISVSAFFSSVEMFCLLTSIHTMTYFFTSCHDKSHFVM
jgi:hypothetical protein